MSDTTIPVAAASETGSTGIRQLKRLWSKLRSGRQQDFPEEQQLDFNLINLLGVGLLPLYEFAYGERPGFDRFEAWIAAHHPGGLPEVLVQQCNALVAGKRLATGGATHPDVLTADDLAHWEEQGYVIVRNAIPAADCAASRALIWDFLGMQEDDPATWYGSRESIQGIMVTLYQHPLLVRNRQNPVIRRAYEQLWGTQNLIVSADKVGFNPPETASYRYRGSGMHWDVSLAPPVPFGTQGILYLTDTAANGGALRLVPGFHRRINDWLNGLPAGSHPRNERFDEAAIRHIAAGAGDFIIWHHALPHDGSPNTAAVPRLVQYFNWFDPAATVQREWV